MGDMDFSPLRKLKETLDAAQKNTNAMMSTLQNFESKLHDVEIAMQPIHEVQKLSFSAPQLCFNFYQKKTIPLSNAKQTIGETLLEIERTYENFRIAGDLEPVINRGARDSPSDFYEVSRNM